MSEPKTNERALYTTLSRGMLCVIDTTLRCGMYYVKCHRYDIEPSGYQLMQNATNQLTFVPRLDDDNTTLYCVATKAGRRQLVAVALRVTGEDTRQRNVTRNIILKMRCGVNLSEANVSVKEVPRHSFVVFVDINSI